MYIYFVDIFPLQKNIINRHTVYSNRDDEFLWFCFLLFYYYYKTATIFFGLFLVHRTCIYIYVYKALGVRIVNTPLVQISSATNATPSPVQKTHSIRFLGRLRITVIVLQAYVLVYEYPGSVARSSHFTFFFLPNEIFHYHSDRSFTLHKELFCIYDQWLQWYPLTFKKYYILKVLFE